MQLPSRVKNGCLPNAERVYSTSTGIINSKAYTDGAIECGRTTGSTSFSEFKISNIGGLIRPRQRSIFACLKIVTAERKGAATYQKAPRTLTNPAHSPTKPT